MTAEESARGSLERRRLEGVRIAAIVVVLLGIALYRQPNWPPTWLDEGFVMNGAETLAESGVYGARSFEGVRLVDQPLVANGPGVVVPLAITMKLFGVGLWQARMSAVGFMVLCGLLAYVTARRLAGPMAGVVALIILVAVPREGFLYFGRMSMGNVPALAYFFGGTLVWMIALERRSNRLGVCAGLLFGLAAVTKAQWSVVLFPALVLVALVDRFRLRHHQGGQVVAAFGGAAAMVGAWYGMRLLILGPEGFFHDLAGVQASAQWTVFAMRPARFAPDSLRYLLRSGVLVVWLIGFLYAAWVSVTRQAHASRAVLLSAISTVWLTWYVVVSVGWERYAFEPVAVSALLAGAALARWRQIWTGLRTTGVRWAAVALAAALAVFVVTHGFYRVADLRGPLDTSAQDFSAVLDDYVAPREVIESWEWQLDILTDHAMHHPSNAWVDRYTAQIFGGVPLTDSYEWREHAPSYLIDGPFSKFTGLYGADLAAGCCSLVASRGPYDLYAVLPVRAE